MNTYAVGQFTITCGSGLQRTEYYSTSVRFIPRNKQNNSTNAITNSIVRLLYAVGTWILCAAQKDSLNFQ